MRFKFFRNTVIDGADVMSSGRLFQSVGPAEANDRSPTVTRRDGRTDIKLDIEVDDGADVETACQATVQYNINLKYSTNFSLSTVLLTCSSWYSIYE